MRVKVEPIKRENESLENKKARLVYQSRKRGILETDLLLSGFAAKYLKDMTPEQLQEYDSLLDELDWDIYYWATKNYETSPLPDKWKGSDLMTKLQKFAENKDKKILRMPDLKEYKQLGHNLTTSTLYFTVGGVFTPIVTILSRVQSVEQYSKQRIFHE